MWHEIQWQSFIIRIGECSLPFDLQCSHNPNCNISLTIKYKTTRERERERMVDGKEENPRLSVSSVVRDSREELVCICEWKRPCEELGKRFYGSRLVEGRMKDIRLKKKRVKGYIEIGRICWRWVGCKPSFIGRWGVWITTLGPMQRDCRRVKCYRVRSSSPSSNQSPSPVFTYETHLQIQPLHHFSLVLNFVFSAKSAKTHFELFSSEKKKKRNGRHSRGAFQPRKVWRVPQILNSC